MNFEVMITDDEINSLFKNARFGSDMAYRDRIEKAILEVASGFRTGHTLACIMVDLGLLTEKKHQLTRRGKYYLWTVYSKRALK